MAMDHLAFSEAVEKLAARVGVQLRYEGGTAGQQGPDPGQRAQAVAVNAAAAEFFAGQLDNATHAKESTDLIRKEHTARGWPSHQVNLNGGGLRHDERPLSE